MLTLHRLVAAVALRHNAVLGGVELNLPSRTSGPTPAEFGSETVVERLGCQGCTQAMAT